MNKEVEYIYDSRGFGTLFINRAEKKNAISGKIAKELNELIDEIEIDKIKFLVVKSAEGNVFCAGGDLNDLNDDLTEEEAYRDLTPMKNLVYKLTTFPLPTICLLHGKALGGGCEIATACDFRIAKEGTSFGFVQANLGILPGWGGGAVLYEKVDINFAYQWLLEAKMYSVDYLKENKWIDKIISNEEWNENLILSEYLKRSRSQMQHLKSQYLERIDHKNLYAKMDLESKRCANLWESDTHKEAVQRFLNR